MNPSHSHAASHAHPQDPGWSLMRLSAAGRFGLAGAIVAALWLATWAVIA